MAQYIKAVGVDSGAEAPPPLLPPETHAHLHPWIGNEFLSKIIWSVAHACVAN